jgi:hypothetical protein
VKPESLHSDRGGANLILLGGNRFTGFKKGPDGFGAIPLPKLQGLRLSSNQFTDINDLLFILDENSSTLFPELFNVQFDNNSIEGTIPKGNFIII